jgi:hypothetical protein
MSTHAVASRSEPTAAHRIGRSPDRPIEQTIKKGVDDNLATLKQILDAAHP